MEQSQAYIIYNLFPTLMGKIKNWHLHLDRIAKMGFNWIYVNPYHLPGKSGSLYSIKDYYRYHRALKSGNSDESTQKDLIEFIKKANDQGMKVMADLVINHTAIDSPLTIQHPDWFVRDDQGKIKNPCVKSADIVTVVWHDLAEINNLHSQDKDNLWQYWLELIHHYISLGFEGFRCDAAYQVPPQLWEYLINNVKQKAPDTKFFAETLGCELKETITVIHAGFDLIFNSSKWWDFKQPWCIEQYNDTHSLAPSISFAESHDTVRLAKETKQCRKRIKMRYLFSTLFSAGTLMPVGFEYGFTKRLDVCKTSTKDWEKTDIDLSDYISICNKIKNKYPIFHHDSPIEIIQHPIDNLLALLKTSFDKKEQALILINLDMKKSNPIGFDDLYQIITVHDKITDISPEKMIPIINQSFKYRLSPKEIKVLYAKA